MKTSNKMLLGTLAIAAALSLSACGGGNDDDPSATDQNALYTVTAATNANLNGVYGSTALGLTGVDRLNPVGSAPEVCSFKFNNVSKVGDSTVTSFGDIRYLPNTNNLYQVFITVGGVEFNSGTTADVTVDRTGTGRILFTNKQLGASSDATQTLRLTGAVPLPASGVPVGC
ncbi:hypothetical protein GT347_05865 [Xylophilus rhododendri]|uniref:Lipoprotein n=1 Tax=Xylophilus rhododendri TaxID=2697032 RepID=A0A857J1H9_9BURK|nr:hypothetical protein [Xylophilus rhododendri]QHI97556.1 hypothetical protein GT347_05865 [Xylophilus rhododendri]